MSYMTALKRAVGTGSAREGTMRHWSTTKASVALLILTPLFLFSGIFFPTETFPHGDTIAWFTPLYHAVRLARGLAQGPLAIEHAVSAIWLVAGSILLLAIIPKLMRKRLVV